MAVTAPQISVDRHRLRYVDSGHTLELYVDWSHLGKTDDCPIDFEIMAKNEDLASWTEPAGVAIDPAERSRILDEIAAYYARGPVADIIGDGGALLRGASRYRFFLQVPPAPSRYYEIGRSLEIPMAVTLPSDRPRLVLDLSNIVRWTDPAVALGPDELAEIVARIRRSAPQVGIVGMPYAVTPVPMRGAPVGPVARFFQRWRGRAPPR